MKNYTEEFKKKITLLHLNKGKKIAEIVDEYGVSAPRIYYWINKYKKNEQQQINETDKKIKELNKKIEELKKENEILKKVAIIFAKEIN